MSRDISKLVADKNISLIKDSRSCNVLSHTLYVDDIMIFCRGDLKSIKSIANLLIRYAQCSGQICNATKSLIYAGAMHPSKHKILANLLGFTMYYPYFLYSGSLIFIGRPENIHFKFTIDRIRLKLAASKASLLSMEGRVQLVKSIVEDMLVHSLSIYKWPISIIKNIES